MRLRIAEWRRVDVYVGKTDKTLLFTPGEIDKDDTVNRTIIRTVLSHGLSMSSSFPKQRIKPHNRRSRGRDERGRDHGSRGSRTVGLGRDVGDDKRDPRRLLCEGVLVERTTGSPVQRPWVPHDVTREVLDLESGPPSPKRDLRDRVGIPSTDEDTDD